MLLLTISSVFAMLTERSIQKPFRTVATRGEVCWRPASPQQYATTALVSLGPLPTSPHLHRMSASRQPHRELGEVTDFAIDRDGAAVLLGDDLVADRQPKPGALAGRLGREE